jgi:methionyl-tRNA formyltransferase
MPRDQMGEPTYAEKVLPGEHRIDWEDTAVRIHRVVRLGRAWTTWHGRRLGVLAVEPLTTVDGGPEADGRTPGMLEGTTVVAGGGTGVVLVSVQPEGKREMSGVDWRRGQRVAPRDRLGGDAAAGRR